MYMILNKENYFKCDIEMNKEDKEFEIREFCSNEIRRECIKRFFNYSKKMENMPINIIQFRKSRLLSYYYVNIVMEWLVKYDFYKKIGRVQKHKKREFKLNEGCELWDFLLKILREYKDDNKQTT